MSEIRPSAARPAALIRHARLVALATGGFLLPWCALLFVTLPATTRARNWGLAWTGLDAAEAIAALATAVLLTRAEARADARAYARASLTAMAGGTLLLVDAWFDVCTAAPGLDHLLALAAAILVELPLAGASIWLAFGLTRAAQPGRSRQPAGEPDLGRPERWITPAAATLTVTRCRSR